MYYYASKYLIFCNFAKILKDILENLNKQNNIIKH